MDRDWIDLEPTVENVRRIIDATRQQQRDPLLEQYISHVETEAAAVLARHKRVFCGYKDEARRRCKVYRDATEYPHTLPDDAPKISRFARGAMIYCRKLRTSIADGFILSAALEAIRLGANAERFMNQVEIGRGEKSKAAKVRLDNGRDIAASARRERWRSAATAMKFAEPKLLVGAAAGRIAKREKQLKLPDAKGARTIQNAIADIFSK